MRARNVRTQPHYQVVIEPTLTGFSAYVPDLPGCVATGQTSAKHRAGFGVRLTCT